MPSGTSSITMLCRVSQSHHSVAHTAERLTDETLDNTAYVLGQIPLMTLQTKAKL